MSDKITLEAGGWFVALSRYNRSGPWASKEAAEAAERTDWALAHKLHHEVCEAARRLAMQPAEPPPSALVEMLARAECFTRHDCIQDAGGPCAAVTLCTGWRMYAARQEKYLATLQAMCAVIPVDQSVAMLTRDLCAKRGSASHECKYPACQCNVVIYQGQLDGLVRAMLSACGVAL